MLEREGQAFLDFVDRALAGTSPGAGLDNFFTQALHLHRRRGFVGGCLFGNTALEAGDTDPVLAGRVRAIFAAWTHRLTDAIAAAQNGGQVRADLPAEHLAGLVVAGLEGGIMQARLEKRAAPLRETLDTLRTLLDLQS